MIIHLLWDEEWKEYLHPMEGSICPEPLEVWLARWTVGVIYRIEADARRSWDLLKLRIAADHDERDKKKPLPPGIEKISHEKERSLFWSGPGGHYPQEHEGSKHFKVTSLLSRCMLLSTQLESNTFIMVDGQCTHYDLKNRVKALRYHELDASCIDMPGFEFSDKACRALMGQITFGSILPSDFRDPTDFIENVLSWLCERGDFHEKNQNGILDLVQALYGIGEWSKFIKKYLKSSKKFADRESKLLLNHIEKNKIQCKSVSHDGDATRIEVGGGVSAGAMAMRAKESSHHQLIGLRQCSTCNKLENKKGEHKACSGCKLKFYCNRDCQLADWKSGHKAQCMKIKK